MGSARNVSALMVVIGALVMYMFREAIEDFYNLRNKNFPLTPQPLCTRHVYEGMLHAEDLTIWLEGKVLMTSGDLQKAFKTGAETVRVRFDTYRLLSPSAATESCLRAQGDSRGGHLRA